MKKLFYFLATCVAMAACSKVGIVDSSVTGPDSNPISFQMSRSNITKASVNLQDASHYNFGVFAYKSTDATNNVMANYLVGYNGSNVGYYMTPANQTTLGDAAGSVDGKSSWAYEKLGSAEYTYSGTDGFYKSSDTKYMSNVANQYLRYWDYAAPTTSFYAYAPYINGAGTATFDNATKTLTIPGNSVAAAYDNPTDNEFMYAAVQIAKDDYGKDVKLEFKRLMSKINIKFWEDIEGYSVEILDLLPATTVGDPAVFAGVQATPAKRTGTAGSYAYALATYVDKGSAAVNFTNITAPAVSWTAANNNGAPLVFSAPAVSEIGTTRAAASASASTYYALPQSDTELGFTFHVSFRLKSDTGETITVTDATVFVPGDNVSWEANKHYTYIFKITKNTNGSTNNPLGPGDPDDPTDPTRPRVDPTDPIIGPKVPDPDPSNPTLFPIVFDNCTVVDWVVAEKDVTL